MTTSIASGQVSLEYGRLPTGEIGWRVTSVTEIDTFKSGIVVRAVDSTPGTMVVCSYGKNKDCLKSGETQLLPAYLTVKGTVAIWIDDGTGNTRSEYVDGVSAGMVVTFERK
jgi:hypothetical protein